MSEFKFACPVCGQRMAVDSSASGAQVECPTCFQIIIVPKAPADGSKYQLSATQYLKPILLPPSPASAAPPPVAHQRKSAVFIFVLILTCAAVTAMFLRERIIRSHPAPTEAGTTSAFPSAVNSLWTLDLTNTVIPDRTVAGEIHGKDFVCRRAVFQNGLLMLRSSPGRDVDAAVNIAVATNAAGGWAGGSFEAVTNQPGPVAGVSLFWREGDMRIVETFTNGFAMKLEFGTGSSNKLPGKIYLCLPDEAKSCAAGTFTAEIRNGQPRFSR